jgi:hypothetical protein
VLLFLLLGELGDGAIPGGCGWSTWQGGEGMGDEVVVAGVAGAEEGGVEVVDQVIIPDGEKVLFMLLLYLLPQFQLPPLSPQQILSFINC